MSRKQSLVPPGAAIAMTTGAKFAKKRPQAPALELQANLRHLLPSPFFIACFLSACRMSYLVRLDTR